jgi:hypothetical protein
MKPSVPFSKILRHVEEPYEYKKIYFVGIIQPFLANFLPASLLGISAGYCQRALVDESRLIIT